MPALNDISALPWLALSFGLVLCRVGSVVMLMPGIGEAGYPMVIRAGLAMGLSFLVWPVAEAVLGKMTPLPTGPALLFLVGSEIFTGLLLGWMSRLAGMILPIAGQILSLLVGLSSVIQPDPELGAETAVLARCMGLLAPVLILVSGAYVLPLDAVAGSYRLLPPGISISSSGSFSIVADGCRSVMTGTGHVFALAVEMTAPFLLLSLIWQVGLGFVARLIPNLQVYNIMTPAQICAGLGFLVMSVTAICRWFVETIFALFSGLPGL